MPGSNLTGCDHAARAELARSRIFGSWMSQYPTPVKPVWRSAARHSVRVFRKPSSAAATVCRRTASRSPGKWNILACA